MNVPVLRETVALSNLSSVAIAVCAVVPFYESGINRITYRRGFYGSLNFSFAAEDYSQINLHYPAFPACFVNSGVFQTLRCNAARTFGPAAFACRRRCDFLAVSLQNSLFVWFILIRCDQIHNMTTGSFLKISNKFINVLCSAFARNNTDYQAMLGSYAT